MGAAITEKEVVRLWQELPCGRELIGEDGESVKVLYPGRTNDGRGADFKDAVISTDNGVRQGDIEVHVKSGDWRQHSHHLDAVYNRVVLHVVLEGGGEANSTLQDGESVPLVVLERNQKDCLDEDITGSVGRNLPCSGIARRISGGLILKRLEQAGEDRFAGKAMRMEEELGKTDAGQCLYQGIMTALGYTKNKEQFLKLACLMPLPFLESESRGMVEDIHCLVLWQALLLGTAGLLPSQRGADCGNVADDGWVEKLESLWISYRNREAMSYRDWEWFKVRPQNHPVRRIVAVSYLLLRYRQSGWLEGLCSVMKAASDSRICRELEEALLVASEGYWANRYDFGSVLPAQRALLGRGRAADIVVNVLSPFFSAWGRCSQRTELVGGAREMYRNFPRLPVNSIERHMVSQLGLDYRVVKSACRQQGLIHIYKTLCTQGKCKRCPLNEYR